MLAVLLFNPMTTKRRKPGVSKHSKACSGSLSSSEDIWCRTCLSTEDLEPIFANKETERRRSQELNLATGLIITMNDGLSQNICSKCTEMLKISLKFRRISKCAEKSLRDLVQVNTVKSQHKTRKRFIGVDDLKNVDPGNDINTSRDNSDDFQTDVYDDSFQTEKFSDSEVKVSIKHEDLEVTFEPPPVEKEKPEPVPSGSPYKCTTCDKEFLMKATFKAHVRFHTNYCVCETCGKRCRNNNQLEEHKRARHGLGRIHKCAYCEYSSATKEALTIHERRHTGERPYVCDHCGATFHRRSNLVQHIAIHLPDKNFQCDLCPKRLKSRKFLQIHKHNAHTGKRYGYLCPICEHSFEKPNKVRAHVGRVHAMQNGQYGPIVRVSL